MNKKEILIKLNELDLNKKDYIIIDEAALVLHNIKRSTNDIYLSCSKKLYKELDWKERKDNSNTSIKYKDIFEIETNFYDNKNIDIIEGYKVLNLEKSLELLKNENKPNNKNLIKKIDIYIKSLDNYKYERELINKGITLIAGVDEVGRGPLVGPVVTACVILPINYKLDGLTDSKKISEKNREKYYDIIKKDAISIGIGIIDNNKIDEINIYEATKLAMKEAINNSKIKPEHVLIDAMKLDIDIPTTSIIKGDLLSLSISAASIIAKVTRDRMMIELDKKYPQYNFKNNKGYPTKDHIEAINKFGIIDEHRKSYGPVKNYLNK